MKSKTKRRETGSPKLNFTFNLVGLEPKSTISSPPFGINKKY